MSSNVLTRRGFAATAALAVLGTGGAYADTTLYTSSNGAADNAVIAIEQAPDGALAIVATYPTGGTGTGGGLGNQGAIAVDDDFLFVINAGSNEVSAFRRLASSLELVGTVPSGGLRPVSVTVDRDVVYVVNAGSDNIAGFRVAESGALSPIPGSTRPLSGSGTGAAQIGFSKDGRVLVVTERATNNVSTWEVGRDGVPGPGRVFASPGATPFGFTFTKGRRLLVSEAAGGAAGASSVSSWRVSPDGTLTVLDPVVPTLQSAACWVAVTPDGRFAYTTNTASGSLTAYGVRGGRLDLLDVDGLAASTGAGTAPIDLAISPDGEFVHVLNAGTDAIASFRIRRNGALEALGNLPGLPDGATGLVAQ
jgi:6-phosphogluconolactonase (cycloisomerase 2 family)